MLALGIVFIEFSKSAKLGLLLTQIENKENLVWLSKKVASAVSISYIDRRTNRSPKKYITSTLILTEE